MAIQKFTSLIVFLVHADTTAVIIQSGKIISNEVFSNFSGRYPKEGLLGHMVTIFLIF